MLSRLIAIMVVMSFVIIPAYAEEGTAATEAPAVDKQDKPARVDMFEQLRQAYEKNDREAMGKILDQMQERREQMRQKRSESRQGRQGQGMRTRQGRPGPMQRFGAGQGRGFGQGQGGFGPGQFGRGMHSRGGWGRQKGFGRGPMAKGWHRGGGRFNQGNCDCAKPRREHAGRRFGQGQGWQRGYGQDRGGRWQQGGRGMRPGWQRNRWSDTDTDCKREGNCKQRSEWDW